MQYRVAKTQVVHDGILCPKLFWRHSLSVYSPLRATITAFSFTPLPLNSLFKSRISIWEMAQGGSMRYYFYFYSEGNKPAEPTEVVWDTTVKFFSGAFGAKSAIYFLIFKQVLQPPEPTEVVWNSISISIQRAAGQEGPQRYTKNLFKMQANRLFKGWGVE